MNKFKLLESIKRVFAISIFICMFLPLYQCSEKADPPEHPSAVTAQSAGHDFIVISHKFDFQSSAGRLDAVPVLGIFCWPLLASLIRLRLRRRPLIVVINLLEIICCAFVLWGLALFLQLWSWWRYGSVILCAGYLGHILASCLGVATQLRQTPHPAPR